MQINDKNHELFLDLNRFVTLEQENPKLLGEIIQKRLDITQVPSKCEFISSINDEIAINSP